MTLAAAGKNLLPSSIGLKTATDSLELSTPLHATTRDKRALSTTNLFGSAICVGHLNLFAACAMQAWTGFGN